MAKPLAAAEASNVSEATFSEMYSAWMEKRRLRDAAVANERQALKMAEKAGINIKAMKELEQRRRNGSDADEQHQRDIAKLGRWMGLPIYTQSSLLDGGQMDAPPPPSAKVAAEFARQSGYECGKAGGNRNEDNPFPAGTPHHVSFDQGWINGQAVIAEGLAPAAKKASTSKKKPEAKPPTEARSMSDMAH